MCGCELWRCLDVHIMLCPSLAAGCCGLTRQVNRADVLQPLLPDTLQKNVNEMGQTRLEWTLGSLDIPFEVLPLSSLSFSPLFFLAVSQYIYESCILVSFPIADSCESTSPLYCVRNLSFMWVIISIFVNVLATGNSPNCALRLHNTALIFTQAMPQGKMMQPAQN